MKKYSVISTVCFLAASALFICGMIAFGGEGQVAVGSACVSTGSALLCLGTFLSRKARNGGDTGAEKNNK